MTLISHKDTLPEILMYRHLFGSSSIFDIISVWVIEEPILALPLARALVKDRVKSSQLLSFCLDLSTTLESGNSSELEKLKTVWIIRSLIDLDRRLAGEVSTSAPVSITSRRAIELTNELIRLTGELASNIPPGTKGLEALCKIALKQIRLNSEVPTDEG